MCTSRVFAFLCSTTVFVWEFASHILQFFTYLLQFFWNVLNYEFIITGKWLSHYCNICSTQNTCFYVSSLVYMHVHTRFIRSSKYCTVVDFGCFGNLVTNLIAKNRIEKNSEQWTRSDSWPIPEKSACFLIMTTPHVLVLDNGSIIWQATSTSRLCKHSFWKTSHLIMVLDEQRGLLVAESLAKNQQPPALLGPRVLSHSASG